MPLTYSPTAQSVAADAAIPDGPVGSIAQWKKVLDTRALVYNAGAGAIVSSGTLSADVGGTNTVFAINLPTLTAINLFDGSINLLVKAGGGTAIGLSKVESAPGNLANSTWYYVYAYLNGSSLDYQISQTAPSAGLAFKSGGVLYRYLGAFRTTSAGAPIPFTMSGGRYVYAVGDVTAATLQVVTAGAAAAYASVPCSTLAPPHCRIVTLKVSGINPVGGGVVTSSVSIQRYGAASTGTHEVFTGVTALQTFVGEVTVQVDSSQRAQYQVNGGANAPVADIYVTGWQE